MATGIRIGWRKLMMLAAVQIAAPTTTMRRTTKQAVSAAHMVLRCHGVGYSFMLDRQTLNSQRPALQSPTTVASPPWALGVDVGYLPCSGAEAASLLDVRRWSRSLRRICFYRQIFANCLLGSFDFLRKIFVFRIQCQRLLP